MEYQKNPSVSVVIPVFNEQERIAASLYKIKDYLDAQSFESQILVIDDGSSDLTTEVVKFVELYTTEVKLQNTGLLQENVRNLGKGHSVAQGLLNADNSVIVFSDADSSTPISELRKLLEKISEGYDVVIGSRNLPGSIVEGRPLHRTLLSNGFNFVARKMGLLTVRDSQCGFKAYRRDVARELVKRQKTFGFCFDVEHLHLADRLGYKIAEVPVTWEHDTGSTISPVADSISMFFDLIKIRLIHWKV